MQPLCFQFQKQNIDPTNREKYENMNATHAAVVGLPDMSDVCRSSSARAEPNWNISMPVNLTSKMTMFV